MSVTPDSVRSAIEAGDVERVRDLVVTATEKERREIRKLVNGMWRYAYGSPMHQARELAWLGTATARQVASEFWSPLRDDRERRLNYDVLAARGPIFVETVARNTVEDGIQRMWPVLRLAVADGLIHVPDDRDSYVRGMVWALGWAGTDADATYRALLDDAELLDGDVWEIFEVDCSTELSNANAWETGDYGALVTGGKQDNRWQLALVRLAHEGRLDRARLLDASLGALLRDFRPSMVGWYAKLHEALEPTKDERRLRIDTYLSLLAGPAPAAMKEGLTGLRAVEEAVSAEDLARAASGPLSQKQKNLAVDMLRLLEHAAERAPEARPALLGAAGVALGHERADVQERALVLLERFKGEAPKAALLPLTDAVAAPLRPRVRALTGIASGPEVELDRELPQPGQWPQPVQPRMTVDLLRSEVTPLEPVESVDELIELAAFLLEGQGVVDDVERLLDGVSRLCDQRPSGFERRTAGLRKRLEEAPSWWRLGGGGGDAVAVVVRSWVTGRRSRGLRPAPTLLGFLAERAVEVAARAARGSTRQLLGFPTHAGGWIDPEVLAERELRVGRFRNRPDRADELQARLRAFPPTQRIRYERQVVEQRAPGQLARHLKLRADGVPSVFGELGERVRAVGESLPESVWLGAWPWGSGDALGARWSLTLAPSFPEIAFAGAATLIADSLQQNPQLHPEVVVEHALGPLVPLDDAAWLAIAGALIATSPDLRRVATDVLVASIGDGRFDPEAAGAAIGWLADAGFAKVSRLAGPLRDAGRVSALHAAQIVRLVEALLAHTHKTPHGLHALLEVALEHAAGIGSSLERADARAALERIAGEVSASSKLGRLARGLLDLDRAAAP